jgi:hypothetical protein
MEIFYSLKEAQVIIGAWRNHYNRVQPAPAVLEAISQQLPTSAIMQWALNALGSNSLSGQSSCTLG